MLTANIPTHLSLRFLKIHCNSGDLQRARHVFNQIPEPDLRAWTLLISAHTRHGFVREAINLYASLRARNIAPDNLLLVSVAKACAVLGDLRNATELHNEAIRFGFGLDVSLGNAMVDMFGKCKFVDGARRVFDAMPVKDVISWTSICSCYVRCGLPRQGLVAFREMGLSGVRPNAVTVSTVLPACSELRDLNSGREIHGYVVKHGMEGNVFVSSALVKVYASSVSIKQAQKVFDQMSQRDVVSWNVLLTAYFDNREWEKGMALFSRMRSEGVRLDGALWNAVIGGCLTNGETEQALKMLGMMQESGFKPNQITVTSLLPACKDLESLRAGKEVHSYIFRNCLMNDLASTTALVFMYAKCGELELSRRVFSLMPEKDTVAWNTMIIGNSMHGNGGEALLLYRNMLESGVKPNSVTYTGVLCGCSHSRLVDEGIKVFESMRDHLVEPDADHYSCLVDILSRAGRLEEAYQFIQRMPMEPTASAWGALLGACRVHKNVELAKIAANRLFEIEPDNPGNYVLLSNIFVTAQKWEEASETRKLMRDRGVAKTPGCSWVQLRNRVYTFVAGDRSNEHSEKIYKFLKEMGEKMRLAGFVPNTDFVLQDVDQEEKVGTLCNHSEKLAVAFAMLNLNGESTIRDYVNVNECGYIMQDQCHPEFKALESLDGFRLIIVDLRMFANDISKVIR
ncbi:hypothetical protein ACLB2K_023281 [Fragaria x ananassa]